MDEAEFDKFAAKDRPPQATNVRASGAALRTLLLVVLLLAPFAVYWQTVSHEYGLRDDYAHLREVREEPGWLTRLTASSGRPIYGVLLEASLQPVRTVADLARLRTVSVVLLTALGILLWQLLRRRGWSEGEAAAIGAAVTLLPGSQVIVGWAIAWPIALGLLTAVVGFWLVDKGLASRGRGAAVAVCGGAAAYFATGLIYQTCALFAVALLAAVLLTRRDDDLAGDGRFVTAHVGILFASLLAGYLLMSVVFTEGVVPESARMRLEPEPLQKLWWFLRQPLPNSLALFELRDRYATLPQFWVALAVCAALVALGYRVARRSAALRRRWWLCLVALPLVAHSVSLAASSQQVGYRTLLPLSTLFLVLSVFALRALAQRHRVAGGIALAALVAVAAVFANRYAFTLIAVPQSREWQLVQAAVDMLPPERRSSVFIVRPTVLTRSTVRTYADEFGSLSADAPWSVTEMFKTALRERPRFRPETTHLEIVTGLEPPEQPELYDFVFDLRVLQNMGDAARRVADARGTPTR